MDTAQPPALPPSPGAISPADLAALQGLPHAPLLLDVRREAAYAASPSQLAGARRCAPEDVEAFAKAHAPGDVVVYCVYGHAVSRSAMDCLNRHGWSARMLAGGLEAGEPGMDNAADCQSWRARPALRWRRRPDLGVDGVQPSVWVTRERPKIDRLACPWLVLRFIDPQARFRYVPTAQVLDVSQREGAVAYDIPGASLSHVGPLCSFDAVLAAFELQSPALQRLATIVRGADTDALHLAPESAGLLAFSLGLAEQHATDDHALLAAALPMYDALYRWCLRQHHNPQPPHRWEPAA